MEHFGTRLKRFREARAWSQEQLGFELDVSKATISKWESGRAQPRLANLPQLRRLCALHGLTLDELLDATDPKASGATTASAHGAGFPVVQNADEALLLSHYRALKPARRKALLTLLRQ
ncbi:MAG: helix-turn-helix transcriptional regulator [Thermomonas sp.]|uniref:helix-turn-helix domain-containing protein n=1 Tax=Thermomonas sp. TaxID=1971895 RepID=UPI0039E645D9